MSVDKLNIIIPIYNPGPGWENQFIDSLFKLRKELEETDLTVILVNDGSTNGINVNGLRNRFKYLKYYSYPVNMGKGYAVRYGINISDADYYIYTDIDFPFGYQIITETYRMLKSSKTNIVIGTRDASYFRMVPVRRKVYSFLLKELNYLITGFRIKDTQAGLKGLDNNARRILAGTETNTFLFELEFLKKSLNQGLAFETITVSCRQGLHFTDFRFQVLMKESISFLKILFKN